MLSIIEFTSCIWFLQEDIIIVKSNTLLHIVHNHISRYEWHVHVFQQSERLTVLFSIYLFCNLK